MSLEDWKIKTKWKMSSFIQILEYANKNYLFFSFKVYTPASYSVHTHTCTYTHKCRHTTQHHDGQSTDQEPFQQHIMWFCPLEKLSIIKVIGKLDAFLLYIHCINRYCCFFLLEYLWVYFFSSITSTPNPWTTSFLDYFKRLLISESASIYSSPTGKDNLLK